MSNQELRVFSNVQVFLDIAKEHLAQCEKSLDAHRTPRTDGVNGYILSPDPERRSFKSGLIAIAFAGVYLDALLRVVMILRLGMTKAQQLEMRTYETKMAALGVTDQDLLARTKDFRESRNDVMHEEPIVDGVLLKRSPKAAQDEAKVGVTLVEAIARTLTRQGTK
jgi:hypothetical protein